MCQAAQVVHVSVSQGVPGAVECAELLGSSVDNECVRRLLGVPVRGVCAALVAATCGVLNGTKV